MLEPVDEHFVEQVRRLASGTSDVRGHGRHRPARPALRRAAPEPPPRPRGPPTAGTGRGLLHDRLRRSRGQRRARAADPGRRPGAAALPVGRVLRRPCRSPRAGAPRRRDQPGPRRTARADRLGGGPDLRRTTQGVRPPGAARDPPDLDDRLPPAAGGRPRVRPGQPGRPDPATALAGGRDRRLLAGRRLGQPLHGAGGAGRRGVPHPSRPAGPDPARLRGQRPRHQHPHPGGLGAGGPRPAARDRVRRGSLTAPRPAAGRRGRRDRAGPGHSPARGAAPEHGAVPRPCGLGRRARVPLPGGDHRRPRARPAARDGGATSSSRASSPPTRCWTATRRRASG